MKYAITVLLFWASLLVIITAVPAGFFIIGYLLVSFAFFDWIMIDKDFVGFVARVVIGICSILSVIAMSGSMDYVEEAHSALWKSKDSK